MPVQQLRVSSSRTTTRSTDGEAIRLCVFVSQCRRDVSSCPLISCTVPDTHAIAPLAWAASEARSWEQFDSQRYSVELLSVFVP